VRGMNGAVKRDWLVLVGVHGSGKTTLGKILAGRLGWVFDREVGEVLRRRTMTSDAEAHAMKPQPAFDQQVLWWELTRDRIRTETARVVETWHPGNLAYAWHRSREVFPALKARVVESLPACRSRVLVQPLVLGPEVAVARCREPGPDRERFAPWLQSVGNRAIELAEELGLSVLPPVDTGEHSLEQAVRLILERLIRFWGGRIPGERRAGGTGNLESTPDQGTDVERTGLLAPFPLAWNPEHLPPQQPGC